MLIGYGSTALPHDFNAFDAAGLVWSTVAAAFVPWADADVANYRIAPAAVGASGRYTAAAPAGTTDYVLRVRGATLAESPAVWTDVVKTEASSGFDGPYPVTINFEDAVGAPVPGVVFVVEGVGSAIAGDGSFVGGMSPGLYTLVAAPAGGVLFPTATFSVDGPETVTVAGAASVVSPPADPAQTTAFITTRDGHGTATGGVPVTFQLVKPPAGDGHSYDRNPFDVESGVDGLLSVSLLKLAGYRARRGREWVPFRTTAAGTFQLPQVLGDIPAE